MFVFVLSLGIGFSVFAKDRTITETVTEANTDESLSGVTVVIKDPRRVVITDMDGYYQIQAKEGENGTKETKTVETWPFDQSAFFILNRAISGSWGGDQRVDTSIFPQSMEIVYLRVYQESNN